MPASGQIELRSFADALRRLAALLAPLAEQSSTEAARVADDVAAALFHADHTGSDRPPVVVLLGGTGTGKSTLANRLIGAPDRGKEAVTATSFRRTFTAGCLAVARKAEDVPDRWLGLPRRVVPTAELPARGTADRLAIVERPTAQVQVVLVDTPDLDGDIPDHHRQADRAFRWAQAILLVATPEKYQLPEVPRYAQLAQRYRLPRRFVLNKADDPDAVADWAQQLGGETPIYVVPRDDASVTIAPDRTLPALRQSLVVLRQSPEDAKAGLAARCTDIAGRAMDQVIAPLRIKRRQTDDAKNRLIELIRPEAGVDVHPMTRHLQRRLRQQSVLYLMGPQRMFERVLAVPSLVARLPRTTWDLVTKGKLSMPAEPMKSEEETSPAIDFRGELVDAFRLLQSRAADVIRDTGMPADDEATWKLDTALANAIADEHLGELRRWLEARWDSKPRDTRALEWLAKNIPGSRHITKLSETAPYLLVALSLATSTVTAGAEHVAIGGYLMTTWLTEKFSNEVAAKTRETNIAIGRAFAELCDRQIKHAQDWADAQAPSAKQLDALEDAIEAVAHAGGAA